MKRSVTTLVLLGLTTLGGCAGEPEQSSARSEPRDPVAVQVATVQQETIADPIAVVGTAQAQSEIVVASKIQSYIRSISVREGSRVEAGQTLVSLDDRELLSGLEASRAAREQAASAILSAEHSIAGAESQLHLAQITHERYSDLLAKDSVSKQEFDSIEAQLKSATSALELAKSRKLQAEAALTQTKAAVVRAETMLGYSSIVSPFSGLVTERLADPGTLASPGAPLLRIEGSGSYRLEVAVPEKLLTSLRVGQTIPFEMDAAGRGDSAEGDIVEIVPAIDANSRTFTLKIGLPSGSGVRSGQYGRAYLPGRDREVLTVPAYSVLERGQLRFVLTAVDGRARRRAVTLGTARNGTYEVLSGLQAGDQLIAQPAGIRDGDAIAVQGSPR